MGIRERINSFFEFEGDADCGGACKNSRMERRMVDFVLELIESEAVARQLALIERIEAASNNCPDAPCSSCAVTFIVSEKRKIRKSADQPDREDGDRYGHGHEMM